MDGSLVISFIQPSLSVLMYFIFLYGNYVLLGCNWTQLSTSVSLRLLPFSCFSLAGQWWPSSPQCKLPDHIHPAHDPVFWFQEHFIKMFRNKNDIFSLPGRTSYILQKEPKKAPSLAFVATLSMIFHFLWYLPTYNGLSSDILISHHHHYRILLSPVPPEHRSSSPIQFPPSNCFKKTMKPCFSPPPPSSPSKTCLTWTAHWRHPWWKLRLRGRNCSC